MKQRWIERPRVTVHYAQTLDGRIATQTGQSQWISGEESLLLAHQLRAEHRAVMVGVGTVLADNPRLTVRLVPGRSPLRVVLDSTLRLPLDANVLSDGAAATLVATTDRAPETRLLAVRHRGAEVLVVDQDAEGRVDMVALLMQLADRGIASLLIEGGRGVITSALRGRLVDRLVTCVSPRIIGTGIEAVGDLDIARLSDALVFSEARVTRLGEDAIFEGWLSGDGGRGPGVGGWAPNPQPLTPNPWPPSAVWFAGPRRVELRREELPPVGPRDVQVRAVVSALSHGTEMLVYRGQVPPDLELDLPTLRGSFSFPIKYGYASVGRVVAVGASVETPREGDLVFVHHPHQTEYVVPASLAVRLPPDTDPEAAVFLANLETAVNVMLDAGPRLGERIVVFGQGTVGLLLVQLVRRVGAGLVVAVDPLARRREAALAVGAEVALPPGEGLADQVRLLTGGVGADLALEASGSSEALDEAIRCVAFQGTVVVCSWYGERSVSLHLGGAFHRGRVRLASSQVSSLDPALQPRWDRARRMQVALDLLPRLRLAPLITHRIPFHRAAEAYELVDRRPEDVGQVVLTYAC